jgi:hypothetical protein
MNARRRRRGRSANDRSVRGLRSRGLKKSAARSWRGYACWQRHTTHPKAKEAEVHKYLEDLELEVLMKGKIFYVVQKVLRKLAVKLSGATMQSWGTLLGAPGNRVTLKNSKGDIQSGTRNVSCCHFCQLGNKVCMTADNKVSDVFYSCMHLDLCSHADLVAMHPLHMGAQEMRVSGGIQEHEHGDS